MSILSQIMTKNNRSKAMVAIVIAIILIALPGFVFSSHKDQLYVDADASGTQDGSSDHPYQTIKKAMNKADGDTEIHIAKGSYKENVEMKDGVDIYGEDKDDVVIEADDGDEPVVKMADDTTINKVTLQKGSQGVRVSDEAKASIIECVIKNNDHDGISIEADDVKKSRTVSISENEIKDNGGAGIYSGKRKLSIVDNEITGNDKDGIDIEKGSSAWIADNKINHNDKSGMKLRIDGSNIWTKNNSIRSNNREGIEVSFGGVAGRINIEKSNIISNDNFGIAKVQRLSISGSTSLWNSYLTFNGKANEITSNGKGAISPIIIAN